MQWLEVALMLKILFVKFSTLHQRIVLPSQFEVYWQASS